jgi:hypothetical protein
MKKEVIDEKIEDPDMEPEDNIFNEAPMLELTPIDSNNCDLIVDQDMQKLEDEFMSGKIDLDFGFPIENIYRSLLI